MENLNGALGFKATLDIDDFNVSAQAMERHIKQVSSTTVSESAQMEQSIQSFAQNGARYIVSYLVGQGMSSLLQSIVQTRGEFQQLEIAFGTMLKSDSKARQLMDELVETAAKTPFDLQGIASSAKQMMAYGSSAESVVDELIMLGNVASGVGASLGDIAYLYGTLRTQGRAYTMDIRQFAGRGIPIYEELAKVLKVNKDQVSALVTEGKVGFAEVEKVFQNLTSSTGMYYNLMQKQSASLTGMISNLEDAWDSVLNEIGTANQDMFAGAISGVTYLVEHYKEILRIVQAITIAYGSYRAAIALNTLATKGYTGVALLDNTARQAKIALMRMEATLSGQAARQTEMMTAAEKAHVAALEQKLSAEERANLVKRLRIATIQQLLTAQQQEYLSNLNLTTSSAEYEAVAMGVLTVEQREALSKTDLSSKSAIYRAALAQEVTAKTQNQAATLSAMRAEVKAAAAKLEAAKESAIATAQATEAARYEVYWAKASGDATRIATAEKKLEAAQENQSLARKAALAAQTEFLAKRKALETTATRQSTAASAADTTAKGAQTAATTMLAGATNKVTLAMKTLWAAMKANPLGWIITLVGALVSAFTLFKSKQDEATDAMGEFQNTTKKEIDNLDLLFAVLQNIDSGSKTYKDTIQKVNTVCRDYNKTLLDESATVDELKAKYGELKAAILETTAAKIKAKYLEQENQDLVEKSTDNYDAFAKQLNKLQYDTGLKTSVASPTSGVIAYETPVMADASNIQNMGQPLREAIQSLVETGATELAKLSGDEFTGRYEQVLEEICTATQEATGATEVEMGVFQEKLRAYLNAQIADVKEYNVAVDGLTQSLDSFFGLNKQPETKGVDYLTMSFEELDKKAKETQTAIDEINAKEVKVEADDEKLKELLETLGKINTATDTKTQNLNTEAGISARIKQLKEERSNVEINSARYNELTKSIRALESRMPKTSSAQNLDSANKQLNQKQLEADRKLEEDRIAVMEDGYEKRKATLDLQHQQNLDRIDKEEKELADARKKAGQGGLSASETAGFNERRTLENQSYEKANTDLFDEEIRYRKEQYQIYFRWVEAMGSDVADKQFASLLKGGASYSQWLNSEIAKLEQKKAQNPESFSIGDQENLFSLTIQRDEVNGVKSAMDLFNESVSRAVGQAANLAERIQAIAQAKEDLANGRFRLGEDDTLAAQNQLDTMEQEAQQELNESILNDFKSYEEKKREIQANFAAMRLTDIAQNNAQILAKINEGEAAALSELEVAQLQASTDWQNLFQNLDTLTASQIQKLVDTIQGALSNTNLKLAPADYKALMESLNQAKQRIVQLNPFQALGKSFSSYLKSLKELKAAQKQNLSTAEMQKYKTAVTSAAQEAASAIGAITQTTDSIGGTIASVADSFGADGRTSAIIEGVSGALGGVGKAAGGAAKIMSGDLIGGITDVISGIGDFIVSLNGMSDALREENIKDLQEEIDALAESYDNLSESIERAYSTSKADMLREQNDLLAEQNEKIRQQISEEEAKKKTDSERIKEWEEQIAENEKQIAENSKYNIIEAIMGTDVMSAIDELANAYADAWAAGETAAEKSAETVKKMIRTAIIEQLKNRLKPEVEEFMSYLANALEDGVVSEAEERMLEQMQNDMNEIADGYLSQNEKWLADDEDSSEDALTGAVRSMSEETGSVIAGRLNAIVINQSDQLVVIRNQLAYQAEIASNTRLSAERLANIESTLKRIETKDSSLLSQGIS